MPNNPNGRRPCRMCGEVLYTPVYYLDETEIARCNNCGFIQIASEQSIRDLQAHYSAVKAEAPRAPSKFEVNKIVRSSRFRADYFQKYTGLCSGSVLEVGSSAGHFLEELRERGFEVQGIEPGPLARRAEEMGITVYREMIENVGLQDESFDAVCMFQVFEHFEDPGATLKLFYAKIKPQGYLLIETPDIYSTGSKFEKTPHKLFNKEHISYFSPRSLNVMAEKAGFSTVITRHCDYDGFRLPFAKMLKRICVPIFNPGFKGPLQRILNREIEIRHRFEKIRGGTGEKRTAKRPGLPVKDIKKGLSAPLDSLLSRIAYALDRGASFYGIYKKG